MKTEIEHVKLSELREYERNARTHPKKQIEQVARSIQEFGFTNPVLIDGSGMIIAGHGRLLAAKEIGLDEVPCIRLGHLSEKQVRALVLADNKIALNSGWDEAALKSELVELQCAEFDLSLLGFSADELEAYVPADGASDGVNGGGVTEADKVPDVPLEPKTLLGDVWLLGRHRLMCGDSQAVAEVERLMNGRKAEMVFTDPPYGIKYSSSKFDGNKAGVTNRRNKAEMIIGDDGDFDPSFILETFKTAKEIFVFGYQYYPDKLGRGGIIVWNKKKETEAANPHGDFELCWSRRERNKMCWLRWGGFENKEKGESRLHTTQKPIALALWFFEHWGKGLKCVVDLFGGSGFTLIACEKTDRDCCMMELDPKYCDVIIKRWQEFTGMRAVNAETGKLFDEVEGLTDGK